MTKGGLACSPEAQQRVLDALFNLSSSQDIIGMGSSGSMDSGPSSAEVILSVLSLSSCATGAACKDRQRLIIVQAILSLEATTFWVCGIEEVLFCTSVYSRSTLDFQVLQAAFSARNIQYRQ